MANRSTLKSGTAHRSIRLGIDVPLLLVVITLIVFGLVMVYSASWDYSLVVLKEKPTFMFHRQLIWLGVGIVIAIGAALMNYHKWRKLALPAMLLTVGALIYVLISNEVINNAARTVVNGSGQPSEAAKLAIVVYLAVWLFAKRDQIGVISFGLIPLGIILGVLGGLIVAQPDLSAAFTIVILGVILFFLAGGDLRQLAILLILGLVVGWIVFNIHPTGRQRLAEYLVSIKDPTHAPMHLARSLEAIVKGKWLGVGIGLADTKLTGLPVPPTDSIFAVISEETGLLGAGGLVILYTLLLWRGLKIALKAPDELGKLLAGGLSLWLTLEAFINMAVIVGLVPFAGNALPFISAGGSSLIVSLVAIGILMNISRATAQTQEEEERTYDAVVDLRWRDGWRRVSRPRRTASAHRR